MWKVVCLTLALAAAGCATDRDPGNATSPQLKGQPAQLNGAWTGPGRAFTPFWSENDLEFSFHVSKIPTALDIHYQLTKPDGSSFSMGRLVGQYIVGNRIYANGEDQSVGQIGDVGFELEREGQAHFKVRTRPDGRLSLTGHLKYGSTKIEIDALLED